MPFECGDVAQQHGACLDAWGPENPVLGTDNNIAL